MPANDRWDVIRLLKVNKFVYVTLFNAVFQFVVLTEFAFRTAITGVKNAI
jgi:hypothetical protein